MNRAANLRMQEMRSRLEDMRDLKAQTLEQVQTEKSNQLVNIESKDLEKINLELRKVKQENTKLKELQRKQERYNRESHVIMKGFVENNQDSRADCKRTALDMLRHAGINLPPMAIELAVRVGSKPGNNRTVRNRNKVVNRPMLVRFLHIEDRDNVLLRKELIYRRCSIEIEEDFPPDMEERRK